LQLANDSAGSVPAPTVDVVSTWGFQDGFQGFTVNATDHFGYSVRGLKCMLGVIAVERDRGEFGGGGGGL
jgi:hypothetical protein